MAKTVIQNIKFKARPDELYQIYMNPEKHAAAVGDKVSLEPVAGGKFSAFDMIEGRFIYLEEGKVIVQTWRAGNWEKKDPDSILILHFTSVRGGGEIDLVHAHIPDYDYVEVQKGWHEYYWLPWKKYLSNNL